ncbi:helix-turn-helix domain-containing protein [Macrococcus animalis]|uniref:helix-turn-helix domain-containing protein n=1 Tax=Macrococcus animalis TaxID=3395467 RepID=UPI0039BE0F4D
MLNGKELLDMDVGNQIRKYRKGMDFSQADLAEKIYVSSQTISNWENERSYPDLHNLIALSVLFNVSLDELVKGDVVEMRNVIDKSSMSKYGNLMMVFIVLSVISIGPAIKFIGMYGLILPLVLWVIGYYYSIKVEQLKKKYNTRNMKEILDFMETGKIQNNSNSNTKQNKLEKVIIVIVFSAIAGVIALVSMLMFL